LAVNETSATTPADAAPPAPDGAQTAAPEVAGTSAAAPGFGARGRVRRRARYLRKARELAYRDLGGLVFNLHRFGQRNDALVLNKLGTLAHIDAELRTLETALGERDTVTVLREAGITACPRCAAIHSGDDRFCPNCGLSMSRHVELPIAGSPASNAAPLPAPGASPANADTAAPAGPAPPSPGQATASWPAPSTTGSTAAAPGDAGSAASVSAAASPAAAKPTPAGGPAPEPPPAAPPAAEEEPTEILRPAQRDQGK
jgi:hypothetical protein